jgi:hypothetical protein
MATDSMASVRRTPLIVAMLAISDLAGPISTISAWGHIITVVGILISVVRVRDVPARQVLAQGCRTRCFLWPAFGHVLHTYPVDMAQSSVDIRNGATAPRLGVLPHPEDQSPLEGEITSNCPYRVRFRHNQNPF